MSIQFFIFHQTLPNPHSETNSIFGLLDRAIEKPLQMLRKIDLKINVSITVLDNLKFKLLGNRALKKSKN
jgi:hypothetical protein